MLRLADLEQSKNAVLHSLGAASSQESYGHAIDEFIGWYCSEPRLSFNRTVVLRYRFFLEQKNLAPSTINVRLAAVRRLAYEASDTGLLSPDLAAGIRRVKGAKRLGVRIGNWLTIDQSRTLLGKPSDSLRGKRDRAILALLIGCGLRRAELVGLRMGDFQVREEHCVIADMIGKSSPVAGLRGQGTEVACAEGFVLPRSSCTPYDSSSRLRFKGELTFLRNSSFLPRIVTLLPSTRQTGNGLLGKSECLGVRRPTFPPC